MCVCILLSFLTIIVTINQIEKNIVSMSAAVFELCTDEEKEAVYEKHMASRIKIILLEVARFFLFQRICIHIAVIRVIATLYCNRPPGMIVA